MSCRAEVLLPLYDDPAECSIFRVTTSARARSSSIRTQDEQVLRRSRLPRPSDAEILRDSHGCEPLLIRRALGPLQFGLERYKLLGSPHRSVTHVVERDVVALQMVPQHVAAVHVRHRTGQAVDRTKSRPLLHPRDPAARPGRLAPARRARLREVPDRVRAGFGGGGTMAGFLYDADPLLPFTATAALALPVATVVAIVVGRKPP